jgi:hypothetical protein
MRIDDLNGVIARSLIEQRNEEGTRKTGLARTFFRAIASFSIAMVGISSESTDPISPGNVRRRQDAFAPERRPLT